MLQLNIVFVPCNKHVGKAECEAYFLLISLKECEVFRLYAVIVSDQWLNVASVVL